MSESLNYYKQARGLLNRRCEAIVGLSLDDLPDIPEVAEAIEEIAGELENGEKPDMSIYDFEFFELVSEG